MVLAAILILVFFVGLGSFSLRGLFLAIGAIVALAVLFLGAMVGGY